jgi:hypothetical protein
MVATSSFAKEKERKEKTTVAASSSDKSVGCWIITPLLWLEGTR